MNKYGEGNFYFLFFKIKSVRMSWKPEHSWHPDPEYFITQIYPYASKETHAHIWGGNTAMFQYQHHTEMPYNTETLVS